MASTPKFSIERLRENSKKLFNVDDFIFDAAMCGKTGEFTKTEVKNIIKTWLNKEAE